MNDESSPKKILILGMGGAFGKVVAQHLDEDPRYQVLPVTTGRKQRTRRTRGVGKVRVYKSLDLINNFEEFTGLSTKQAKEELCVVDCSKEIQWQVAGRFAGALELPVLMLNTNGINDQFSERRIEELSSRNDKGFLLLRCPNALTPFVALMRALESIADVTPSAFAGLTVKGSESHQQQKGSEIAGTLKRLTGACQKADAELIYMKNERNPKRQVSIWRVPKRFLRGHAYHLIILKGPDFGIELKTWVHGRKAYARGIRDAALPHLIWLKAKDAHGIHVH